MIARIQSATGAAYARDSVASRLKFDREKLLWELDFFLTHYFETYRKRPLPADGRDAVWKEFEQLAGELESRAAVLCHRDFHAANLMIDPAGRLRIIDHQDARIGSPAYDLVSLILDRVTVPPEPKYLADKRHYLINKRVELGLSPLDEEDFAFEFRLQTIQRCLKAIGTFSFQSVNRGKTYFVPFIRPMFEIVERALGNTQTFPNLERVIKKELADLAG